MIASDVEPWRAFAECRGMDTNLFFPTSHESTKEAKRTCASCLVRTECLEYAPRPLAQSVQRRVRPHRRRAHGMTPADALRIMRYIEVNIPFVTADTTAPQGAGTGSFLPSQARAGAAPTPQEEES